MNVYAIDWGDVPTWISAITTALALIAASVVVFVELRRDRRDVERRTRAEQADMIVIWGDEDDDGPVITLRNNSNLPIFDVVVQVRERRERSLFVMQLAEERVIPPGDRWFVWPTYVYELDSDGAASRDRRDSVFLTVIFSDTGGRRWTREAGQLTAGLN